MGLKAKILPAADGYNQIAGQYDKKQRYLDSFEKGRLLPLLGEVADKQILDAGAGTGRLAVQLAKAGAIVTALDVSALMLAKLEPKAPGRIKLVVGDAEDLELADNSFDIIVAAFLLVHLKDPRLFLAQAYRVLKDGGRLLLTNINQKRPPLVAGQDGSVKIESYYHRPEKIREMLTDLAFRIVDEVIIKEGEIWINQIVLVEK